MFHVVTGTGYYTEEDKNTHHRTVDICVICSFNGHDECEHRQVLHKEEIQRKTSELKELLLKDARRVQNNDELQLKDILPDGLSVVSMDTLRTVSRHGR